MIMILLAIVCAVLTNLFLIYRLRCVVRELGQRFEALTAARQSFSQGGTQLRERLARMAAETK